jgi:hypothetical protein
VNTPDVHVAAPDLVGIKVPVAVEARESRLDRNARQRRRLQLPNSARRLVELVHDLVGMASGRAPTPQLMKVVLSLFGGAREKPPGVCVRRAVLIPVRVTVVRNQDDGRRPDHCENSHNGQPPGFSCHRAAPLAGAGEEVVGQADDGPGAIHKASDSICRPTPDDARRDLVPPDGRQLNVRAGRRAHGPVCEPDRVLPQSYHDGHAVVDGIDLVRARPYRKGTSTHEASAKPSIS